MRHLHLSLASTLVFAVACTARAEPLATPYLYSGKLADGAKALEKHLKDKPDDDEARFGLGFVQFFQGFENLGRGLYKHGLRTGTARSFVPPPLAKVFPENPKPEKINYADLRKLVQAFVDDMNKADATFAKVKDEKVKLPIQVGRVQLDLFGSGAPVSAAGLLTALGLVEESKAADALLIKFDRGDACWARGYVNMMAAWGELLLALDGKELFDSTAHRFFLDADTPLDFLKEDAGEVKLDASALNNFPLIADAVSMIFQVLHMPIGEPERLKKVLAHLETTVAQGKLMWKYIQAETDDDHEWIPNAKQKAAIGVAVNQEMIDNWLATLNEAELILSGKKLLPFWRGKAGARGVNLRKAFTDPPKRLDIVRWVQGPAAAPYLENGTITNLADEKTIQRLDRVFGGARFFGFAFWFN
jgi:hypothetical protein